MDRTDATGVPVEAGDAIIVKADEVDESGADISIISPTDAPEAEFTARIESRRAHDAQGSPKTLANAVSSPPKPLVRPVLQREGSTPAPPQQPPPPAPPQREELTNATDSLSLLQLKRLVTDLPKLQPTAYAYAYAETRSFPEELEEWFQYTEEERYMLLRAKQTFTEKWEQAQAERPDPSDNAIEWTDVDHDDRESFTQGAIDALDNADVSSRIKSLECLSYIALGAWGDTAGQEKEADDLHFLPEDTKWIASQSTKPYFQIRWILNGVQLLYENGAVHQIYILLKRFWDSEQSVSRMVHSISIVMSNRAEFLNYRLETVEAQHTPEHVATLKFLQQIEVNQSLTILYTIVEAFRWQQSKIEGVTMAEDLGNIVTVAIFDPANH